MITKNVGRITYAWNPNALNGKGWWFELGKDGNLGLAATRALGARLGQPKPNELPPRNVSKNKYYFTPSKSGKPSRKRYRTSTSAYGGGGDDEASKYEVADVTSSKGLGYLASEKMMSGKGLGASLKEAFKDKIAAKATSFKKKFDPMNMLSKISPLAATAYGKKFGRKNSDISYFTGVRPTADPAEMEKSYTESVSNKSNRSEKTQSVSNKSNRSEKTQTAKKVSNKGETIRGGAGTLKQIYKIISDKFEEDIKLREIDKNFEEEKKSEDERRHKELIDAILKGKGPKGKEKKEEKKSGLFDMLGGLFGMIKGLPGMLMGGLSSMLGLKTLGRIGSKMVGGVFSAGKSIVKGGVELAGKAGSLIKGGVKSAMGFGSSAVKSVGSVASKGVEAAKTGLGAVKAGTATKAAEVAEKAGSALAKGGKTASKIASGASKLLKGGGKLLGFLKAIPGLSLITAGADLVMRIKEVNDKKEAGEISDADYKKEITKAIGSAAAAGLLPILGGAIGSVVPGVGTVIGGLGGAAAALLGGDKIGGWLAGKMYDFFVEDKKGSASEVKKDTASPVPSASSSGSPTGAPGASPTGSSSASPSNSPSASPSGGAEMPSTARVNAAVSENQSLVGPSATMSQGSPTINKSTTNIMGGGGGGGGGSNGGTSIRNEEPILMRVQYGKVRPV